jgi:hypothetical protein
MPNKRSSSLIPVKPLHDNLFIDIVDRNVTTKLLNSGHVLHLISDDYVDGVHNSMSGKHPGIRPRWARIIGIGPKVYDKVSKGIELGNFVLCDTLKWSRQIPLGRIGLETVYFWRINVDDILLIDDSMSCSNYIMEFLAHISKIDFMPGRR